MKIPENTIGCTGYDSWSADYNDDPLGEKLKKLNIPFDVSEIQHLVGMAGCARLLFYDSPSTGAARIAFVIPYSGGDTWGEEYFYFDGISKEDALKSEQQWVDRYDECRKLRDQAIYNDPRIKRKGQDE